MHRGQQTAIEKELRSGIKCPWRTVTEITNTLHVAPRGTLRTKRWEPENTRGDPKPRNLFIKKLCIYSHVRLQSPSKYSPSDTIRLLRHFYPQIKTGLNTSILVPFGASTILCFTFFMHNVSLWELFSPRETEKGRSGQDQMNKECGAWG